MMTSNNPKIIDVTLRESIYTDKIISYYEALDIIKLLNRLSFCDYIEIGYINTKETDIDLNKYNEDYIKNIKKITTKKISAMTHLNQFNSNVLVWNKNIIKEFDMVRIIIDSDISNLFEAIDYFHNLGVKVSINCSYLSRKNINEITILIKNIIASQADIIYIADTNGSMLPNELDMIYNNIKKIKNNIEIGFHGHDHYNLVVSNTWKMIDNNIDYIDTTIGGFGKGAGNLRLEIVPFLLNRIKEYQINKEDIYILYEILDKFDKKYINDYLNLLYSYKNLTNLETYEDKELRNLLVNEYYKNLSLYKNVREYMDNELDSYNIMCEEKVNSDEELVAGKELYYSLRNTDGTSTFFENDLKDISFEVNNGDIISIIGFSGS